MPLVFIVLIAVGAVIIAISDVKVDKQKEIANYCRIRKTNARLEQSLVSKYLLQGCSLKDAYKQIAPEMAAQGFVLCMSPKSFITDLSPNYGHTIEGHSAIKHDSSLLPARAGSVHDHNSDAVKLQHKIVELQWKLLYPDRRVPDFPDKTIYKNFPKNDYEYKERTDLYCRLLKMYPVGTLITIPGDGDYEIIEISMGERTTLFGKKHCMDFKMYLLQNIETGEIRVRSTKTEGVRQLK